MATIGALGALRHREATGEGQVVDVALMDVALSSVEIPLMYFLLSGIEGGEQRAAQYKTADGWMVINASTEAHRVAVLSVTGAPVEAERVASDASSELSRHSDALVREWCRARRPPMPARPSTDSACPWGRAGRSPRSPPTHTSSSARAW
jgi:crotonobetainyl-CoA:carnitine CoA-transferase CaiB-like acyl-CoA transferase